MSGSGSCLPDTGTGQCFFIFSSSFKSEVLRCETCLFQSAPAFENAIGSGYNSRLNNLSSLPATRYRNHQPQRLYQESYKVKFTEVPLRIQPNKAGSGIVTEHCSDVEDISQENASPEFPNIYRQEECFLFPIFSHIKSDLIRKKRLRIGPDRNCYGGPRRFPFSRLTSSAWTTWSSTMSSSSGSVSSTSYLNRWSAGLNLAPYTIQDHSPTGLPIRYKCHVFIK